MSYIEKKECIEKCLDTKLIPDLTNIITDYIQEKTPYGILFDGNKEGKWECKFMFIIGCFGMSGEFFNNKKNGEWTYTWSDYAGNLKLKIVWDNGTLVNGVYWNSCSTPSAELLSDELIYMYEGNLGNFFYPQMIKHISCILEDYWDNPGFLDQCPLSVWKKYHLWKREFIRSNRDYVKLLEE